MNLRRRDFLQGVAAAGALGIPGKALAQAYASRPVHILVGLAAGGPTDVAARVIAEWLSQQLGQQFVVENRTGMGGNLANQALINSPPDGYTLLFSGPTSTISASLYKKLPFNFVRDTVPVAAVMRFPNLMVVGASPHLSGELFKYMAKVDLVHVPYRGSAAAYPDLMTGKVHVLFDNLGGPVLELVRGGKPHALGVTTAERWPPLPNIPAIAETVPGYQVDIWYGMYAPRNTPAPVVAALNTAVNAGLEDAHVKARIVEGGGLPMPMTPAQFGRFTLDDIEKCRKVVEFAGLSAD